MPTNYISRQVDIADSVHIIRMIEDGDVVVAQSVLIYNRSDRSPEVVVDVFRYDGQKIVERWANIEAISDGDSWQTRTQRDTLITDRDKTEANKKLAEEYEKKTISKRIMELEWKEVLKNITTISMRFTEKGILSS
jgi:putative lipoprotein